MQDESPEVVIPVVPPVCDHSNKEAQTPVSDHPGRFHCEDCSTCYGEPLPTEAAIARDKKALKKHKFPKSTPGADSIALGGDIAKTAKIVDTAAEEAARDNDLAVRAVPVLAALRDYVTVCKAEEAAVNLRETFLEKLKDRDALFLIAQELGDFFSVRRGRKFTLPNGNTYTSVKVLIKDEVGCSYEYFLSLGKKLGKFQRVLPSDARPALQPKPQTSLPPQAPTQTPINIPAETEEPPQEEPQLSHSSSVSERVQFALAAVTKCAKFLSPSETDEFYGSLIAKLQSEMQFDVEVADEVEEEVEA